MQLILIRHGKTNWNETGKCQGISDVPLNQNGLEQAEKLALSLKDEELDVIYSSDLQRAYTTAKKIADYHSLEVNIESGFREMDQGGLEGLEFSYIRDNYQHVLKRWRENPEAFTLPGGGESMTDVQNRAYVAVSKLITKYSSKRVVVVSHNLTIITLLCKFSGKSMKYFRDFAIDECSKSIVEINDGDIAVKSVNDTSHL